LVFFVEGDIEKVFLETLVPRILGIEVTLRVVRVGSEAALSTTFFETIQFLESGYSAAFLLFNTGTTLTDIIRNKDQRLKKVFQRYGLAKFVHIHAVVPMLEAWLLAAYCEYPERSEHPQRDLARYVGSSLSTRKIKKLTEELSIELTRHRAKSLNRFITALEAFK